MNTPQQQSQKRQRLQRLFALDDALATQIRALERQESPDTTRASSGAPPSLAHPAPTPPPGMKLLYTPKQALVEDPRIVANAVDAWLFWRVWLAHRTPTHAGLLAAYRRLVGAALWAAARQSAATGHILPLKDRTSFPEWAIRPPNALQRTSGGRGKHPHLRSAQPSDGHYTRVYDDPGGGGGTSGTSGNSEDADVAPDRDTANPDTGAIPNIPDDAAIMDWWAANGDLSLITGSTGITGDSSDTGPAEFYDVNQLRQQALQQGVGAAGDALTFEDILGASWQAGMSDLQVAQLLNASWSGQASLWAGQDVYANAGIAGAFDITDPYFLDYLRNQSGSLISGIDEATRALVSETLWSFAGGVDGLDILSPQAMARALMGLNSALGTDLADMSYSRALTISITEMARAESFGGFVAMYQTGVTQKIWMVTAGACLICEANEEQGPVNLLDAFPSGDQAPPAHPRCRCAASGAIPQSFDPTQWTPRNPNDLNTLLFSTGGGQWPDVDLSDLQQLSMTPTVTRSLAQDYPDHALVGDVALVRAMHAHTSPTSLADLGARLAQVARAATQRWFALTTAQDTHVPRSEATLKALGQRVREHPDQFARADARCLDHLTSGFHTAIQQWRDDAK